MWFVHSLLLTQCNVCVRKIEESWSSIRFLKHISAYQHNISTHISDVNPEIKYIATEISRTLPQAIFHQVNCETSMGSPVWEQLAGPFEVQVAFEFLILAFNCQAEASLSILSLTPVRVAVLVKTRSFVGKVNIFTNWRSVSMEKSNPKELIKIIKVNLQPGNQFPHKWLRMPRKGSTVSVFSLLNVF